MSVVYFSTYLRPLIKYGTMALFSKSNRKQRVVLNGQTSSWADVNAGVRQGSILGPLLFLIYVNDLAVGLSSNAKLFADDTSFFLLFIMQIPQLKN